MGNEFEQQILDRIRADWNRFVNGQMDPDEASRYREVLRDNKELLDEGTRRLIDEGKLLDDPAPPAPVAGVGQPVGVPLTDGAAVPEGKVPFGGTGGLDDLGKAMAERDTTGQVGMVPPIPGSTTPPASFETPPGTWVPNPDYPAPSEPAIGDDPGGFGIPGGTRTLIVGGAVIVLAVIGGVFIFGRPGTGTPTATHVAAPVDTSAPAPVAPAPAPVDFTLALVDTWYFHNGPGDSCAASRWKMSPAIKGSTGTVALSGPGVVQTGDQPLTFDSTGTAAGSVKINQYGNYTATAKVTAGGVTKTASAPLTVTSTQGPRPCQ